MLRSLNSVRRGFTSVKASSAPLVQSLPGSAFCDPNLYQKERTKLLGPSWQLLTHESLLTKNAEGAPATYVAESASGYPCIITRSSKDGTISGFHNVCRHKAGPLEFNGTHGACKLHGLACKYHGWAYNLRGELKGMPRFGDSSGMDKKKFGLWPLRVARWRGFIYVQALPDAAAVAAGAPMSGPEVDAAFASENRAFVERMQSFPLDDMEVKLQRRHTLQCNWKVYVENYLEGYHIPVVHPELNRQVDMDEYHVLVKDGFIEHKVEAAEGVDGAYEGIWLYQAPTLALNCYGGGGMSVERIVPTGLRSMEIHYLYLFPRAASQADIDAALSISGEVTQEDIDICEHVQNGLDSGSYTSPGMLSPRHENGVAEFQRLIRKVHEMKD